MAIDMQVETLFPLSELPEHAPPRKGGKKLHQSTGFRWAQRGVRGVMLETIRVGGALYTSSESFARFCAALSTGVRPEATIRSPAGRRRAVAQAERALDAMGI